MIIQPGKGTTKYGPGVSIVLTGDEVASAIDAWLAWRSVHIRGPRTITVNGELCKPAEVYVDPAGYVMYRDEKISGRHAKAEIEVYP